MLKNKVFGLCSVRFLLIRSDFICVFLTSIFLDVSTLNQKSHAHQTVDLGLKAWH